MELTPGCETRIKLTIVNASKELRGGFGHGSAALLHGVQETGSLNAAAKRLGMAYSKAWRLIKDAEEELGIKLLLRDGARGSTLTAEGLEFLTSYDALLQELHEHANKQFARLFGAGAE